MDEEFFEGFKGESCFFFFFWLVLIKDHHCVLKRKRKKKEEKLTSKIMRMNVLCDEISSLILFIYIYKLIK